jgi:FixJ family two-component response regulator
MPDPNLPPLIHVIDDDESLRNALVRLLEAAGFEARGHASAGDFLLQPAPDRPGCLLLDVRMPGPSGLDLQAALPGHRLGLPVIFMTGFADVPTSVRAMKAGAVDFLEKPVQRQDLLDAIARALVLDKRQRRERSEIARLRERFALLTVRERDVLEQVVAGKLNKQIAAALDVSERTIKTLRAQGMDKLGVASPAELGVQFERLRHEPEV